MLLAVKAAFGAHPCHIAFADKERSLVFDGARAAAPPLIGEFLAITRRGVIVRARRSGGLYPITLYRGAKNRGIPTITAGFLLEIRAPPTPSGAMALGRVRRVAVGFVGRRHTLEPVTHPGRHGASNRASPVAGSHDVGSTVRPVASEWPAVTELTPPSPSPVPCAPDGGVSLKDLAQRLRELEFSELRIEHIDGAHFRVRAFAVTALQRQQPVIISFAPVNRPRHLHAVLAIGLSGGMQDRRFVPSALLTTDSSEEPPGFGPANARLEFSPGAKRERTGLYMTAWNRCRVTLTGAIALQLVESASKDFQPP